MDNLKSRVHIWAKRVGWDVAAYKIEQATHYGESASMKIACGHYPSKVHASAVKPLEELVKIKLPTKERCLLRTKLRQERQQ